MPYAEGRTFHDADSHVMEIPGWLASHADPAFRDRIPSFSLGSTGLSEAVRQMIARGERRAGDPAERPAHEEALLTARAGTPTAHSTPATAAAQAGGGLAADSVG